MSEVKHTPGPWVWRGKDGGLYQEGTTHRFGDAVMVPTYEYDSGIDIEISDADARLIAAAPEMLEALEEALMYIERDETTHGRTFRVGNVVRAAISKAKGKTEE